MTPRIEQYREATNSMAIRAGTFTCAKCGQHKLLQGRTILRMVGKRQVWQCKCCAKVAS
jgi:transcription elongation factor Elf1